MYTQYHNSLHCCLTSAQTMISRVVTAVLFHIQFNPRYFRHLNQATISKALEMVNITYIMKAKVSSPAVNLPGFLQLFHIVFTPIMLTEEISLLQQLRPRNTLTLLISPTSAIYELQRRNTLNLLHQPHPRNPQQSPPLFPRARNFTLIAQLVGFRNGFERDFTIKLN